MVPLYYVLVGCLAALGGLAAGWLVASLVDPDPRLQGVLSAPPRSLRPPAPMRKRSSKKRS